MSNEQKKTTQKLLKIVFSFILDVSRCYYIDDDIARVKLSLENIVFTNLFLL